MSSLTVTHVSLASVIEILAQGEIADKGWLSTLLAALTILAVIFLAALGFFFTRYFKLWFQAYMSVALSLIHI